MIGEPLTFPKWRMNSTPIEKLKELLQYAELNPDEMQKLVVIWVDTDGDLMWSTSGAQQNYETTGIIEMAKMRMLGLHTHGDEE